MSEVGLVAAFAAGLALVVATSSLPAALLGSALLSVVAIHAILLFHDCMHASAWASRRVETILARAIGAFYGCPFHFLRHEHLRHHRNAGLVDGDPEALHLHEHDAARRPHGRLLAAIARSPLGAWLYTWVLQLGQFARWIAAQVRQPTDRELIRQTIIDVGCMVALWVPLTVVLAAHGLYGKVLLFAFALPAVLGLAVVYKAARPLHTLMVPFKLDEVPYTPRQFYVTRTFDCHPLVSLLVCNLNYHLEHHLYPHVSRWDLPALSREVRPDLVAYARRHDVPLAIHDGYGEWVTRQVDTYNPIASVEDWARLNGSFRYVDFHAPGEASS